MKPTVAVLFGGRTVEHEVAIISAVQALHAIDKDKYNVLPVYITKEGIWYTGDALYFIENYKDVGKLTQMCKKILVSQNSDDNTVFKYPSGLFSKTVITKIDVAFPIFHGTHGEDGCLQGFLELMNIPYVGCDVLSSALGMDKIMMKIILKDAGLPILKYTWFSSSEWLRGSAALIDRAESELGYPIIVKPANLGSSIGIKRVTSRDELKEAVAVASSFSHRVLFEEMVRNLMEINCAVMGDHESVEASVCEEPVSSADILSFQDKYLSTEGPSKGMSGAKRRIPADIPEEKSQFIQGLAKKAFQALNCSGGSRVDFLCNRESGKIFVNEINTIPGSLAFYLWEATGKPFPVMLDQLIQLALKKSREKNNLMFSHESNILSDYRGAKGAIGIKGKV